MNVKEIIYIILVVSQIIFCIISYLPQIIQLLRTKKSEDISISTYVLLTLSFIDYSLILIMDSVHISLIILNTFELTLCLLTTILVIRYKKRAL